MKIICTLIFLISYTCSLHAQQLYYPPISGNQWDTTSPSSLGWCGDKIDSLYSYLNRTNTKAFIVLKDGKIVLEKYFGTFTKDSVWYWASAGKSLTGFLIGLAQQDGYLDINDATRQYLGGGWTSEPLLKEAKIKIKHQLTMTTGLDDSVPDKDCTDPSCLLYKKDAGTRWAYHNGPYTLLDTVLQVATGYAYTINSYFNQKVGNVTGMTGLYITADYNHVFYSKARSMARYGLLIQGKGKWNGTTIMTDTAYFHQMLDSSQQYNPSYGYLWWLNGKSFYRLPGTQFPFAGSIMPNAPADVVAALGRNGQIINVAPAAGLVLIRMGNESSTGDVSNFYCDTIWQKLNAVMCSNMVGTNNLSAPVKNNNGWEEQLVLYPTPADEYITLDWKGAGSLGAIEILGMDGRLLKSMSYTPRISLKDFPAGTYLLRLHTSLGAVVKRFSKQ